MLKINPWVSYVNLHAVSVPQGIGSLNTYVYAFQTVISGLSYINKIHPLM